LDNGSYWKNPIVAGEDRPNHLAYEKDAAKECCRMMLGAKNKPNAKLLPDEDHQMLGVDYMTIAKRRHMRVLNCRMPAD